MDNTTIDKAYKHILAMELLFYDDSTLYIHYKNSHGEHYECDSKEDTVVYYRLIEGLIS